MFSYHSDQMSQRSQVSRIALWGCSLNVFVIVYVFVIVFVYFIVFLLVRLCLLITPIKCLKVHKFLGMLSGSVCNNGHSLTYLLSDKVTYRAVWGQLKNMKYLMKRNIFFSITWNLEKRCHCVRLCGCSFDNDTKIQFHKGNTPQDLYLNLRVYI